MKKSIYRKSTAVFMCIILTFVIFCLGVSATQINNRMTTRTGSDNSTTESSVADDSMMGNDTYEGNIDSGDDGHIAENSGTGEFADDTSDNNRTGSVNTTDNPVESVVDGVAEGAADAVDDATSAVDDATDGNMWGIIIAIIIIAAVAALLFAFFSRKK